MSGDVDPVFSANPGLADDPMLLEIWRRVRSISDPCHELADYPLTLVDLGVIKSEIGDLEGADAAYHEAIAINPRFHQARINAGLVAERQDARRTRGRLGHGGRWCVGKQRLHDDAFAAVAVVEVEALAVC